MLLKRKKRKKKTLTLRHNLHVLNILFQLSVRGKNKKERIGGFFKTISKSADEVLLSNHKVNYTLLNIHVCHMTLLLFSG